METLARWVSIAGHPFVMVVVLALEAGGGAPRGRGLVLIIASIFPIAWLMRRQTRSGRWQNADASRRSERPFLYVVALATLALFGAIAWWTTDTRLERGFGGAIGLVLASAIVTRWLKTSFMPIVAWSRLRLSRHQPAELVVGAILGAASGAATRFV
jgi:preprotein translocase subunit SecY